MEMVWDFFLGGQSNQLRWCQRTPAYTSISLTNNPFFHSQMICTFVQSLIDFIVHRLCIESTLGKLNYNTLFYTLKKKKKKEKHYFTMILPYRKVIIHH